MFSQSSFFLEPSFNVWNSAELEDVGKEMYCCQGQGDWVYSLDLITYLTIHSTFYASYYAWLVPIKAALSTKEESQFLLCPSSFSNINLPSYNGMVYECCSAFLPFICLLFTPLFWKLLEDFRGDCSPFPHPTLPLVLHGPHCQVFFFPQNWSFLLPILSKSPFLLCNL